MSTACVPPNFCNPPDFAALFPNLIGPTGPAGAPMATVLNIAALRAYNVSTVQNNGLIQVMGYYLPGDQGGGLFYLDTSSSSSDNGGTIIQPTIGGGRWIRIVNESPLNIRWFGAKGDGITNDAPSIQLALNTGESIFVPETDTYFNLGATLNLTAAGQSVFGAGAKSKLVQQGINANSSVFLVSVLGNNLFADLNLLPNPTTSDTVYGYGVVISGSDNCTVRGCRVSGHRRGGVLILNSNFCKVYKNNIRDSIVNTTPPANASGTGYDVALAGTSSYNSINDNYCVNGAGVGVAIFSLTNGDTLRYNTVSRNTIENQPIYGVMVYRLNSGDLLEYNKILGNTIDTITGNIPDVAGLFEYGAGVYVQTSNYTMVDENVIRNTNVHVPDVVQLPAAIAFSDSSGCTANANKIFDANYYGIAAQYGSAIATPLGKGVIISNNDILRVTKQGIYLLDYPSANISDNRIYGNGPANIRGTHGIFINQVSFTQSDDFIISENRVEHCDQCIVTNGTINRVICGENVFRDFTIYGMRMTATTINITDNIMFGADGSTGISVTSTCASGFVTQNTVACAGGGVGINQDAGSTVTVYDNDPSASSIPYSTDAVNQFRRDLANSATPSVKNGKWFRKNDTTTITGLNNGQDGQLIEIYVNASATFTNGINLRLAGGVNFAATVRNILTLSCENGVWTEVCRSVN